MLKKLFFLCLVSSLQAVPIQHHPLNQDAVQKLADLLGIPEGSDIVQQTQSRWLRHPHQERWEMTELEEEQKALVLTWAQHEGFYDAWTPNETHYDQAIILGATTYRMQSRLGELKRIWQSGVRFDEILFLTGDRPLDPIETFTDSCQTETEAAYLIFQITDLPKEMRELPFRIISVPMSNIGRPNTKDTILAYAEEMDSPKKALFISDAPFCGYQFAVINAYLPDAFLFDVAGKKADPSVHPAAAAITLDAIARWLYQEKQL